MTIILEVAFVPVVGLVLIYSWELVKHLLEPEQLARPIIVRGSKWQATEHIERRSPRKARCGN
jgi:hypothetical protein